MHIHVCIYMWNKTLLKEGIHVHFSYYLLNVQCSRKLENYTWNGLQGGIYLSHLLYSYIHTCMYECIIQGPIVKWADVQVAGSLTVSGSHPVQRHLWMGQSPAYLIHCHLVLLCRWQEWQATWDQAERVRALWDTILWSNPTHSTSERSSDVWFLSCAVNM